MDNRRSFFIGLTIGIIVGALLAFPTLWVARGTLNDCNALVNDQAQTNRECIINTDRCIDGFQQCLILVDDLLEGP